VSGRKLRGVDVGPVIAVAAMAVLTVAGHFLLPSRAKRIQRALEAHPHARVHEAQGAVRVTGRVCRDGELLQAPITGRSCVAYEATVRVTIGGGDGTNWVRLLDERRVCPFLVEDESGRARIDADGHFLLALARARHANIWWFSSYPGKHHALSVLLESAGIRHSNWLGLWKPITYLERVLEEGDLVSVAGASAREVDAMGERSGPRSPPERLVLRGTEDRPLLISDPRSAGS
jgi:hypothetical protein